MADFTTSVRATFQKIAADIKAIRNGVPTATSGLYASRPAATTLNAGSTYVATDLQEQYLAVGTPGSKATSWMVIPAGGTELAYAQTLSAQTIPVQTTNNTPVDLTGLTISVKMPERPIMIVAQLLGRYVPTTANTGQDGTFRIYDADADVSLNEAHVGYQNNNSEFANLYWGARIEASTPGTVRNFKLVGMGKSTGVLTCTSGAAFPAFIRAVSL